MCLSVLAAQTYATWLLTAEGVLVTQPTRIDRQRHYLLHQRVRENEAEKEDAHGSRQLPQDEAAAHKHYLIISPVSQRGD